MSLTSLTAKKDFDLVFIKHDKKIRDDSFVILIKLRPSDYSKIGNRVRVGFAVSKKAFKRSVDRNRFKRVFRSVIYNAGMQSCDIVIIAKKTHQFFLHSPDFYWKILDVMKKLSHWINTHLINKNDT